MRPLAATTDVVLPLGVDERHRFSASLPAGHSLRLEVEQRGVDLILELTDPRGELILRLDSPNGRIGGERLAMTAQTSGRYQLAVTAHAGEPPGDYRLRVEKLGPSGAADRARSEALSLYLEAEKLRREADTRAAAIDTYRRALDLWQQLGDEPLLAARAVRRLALVLYEQGRIGESIEPFERALRLYRRHAGGWELAPLLNELGYAYRQLGEPGKALLFFEEALETSESLGQTLGAAVALNNMGVLHDGLGRQEEALRTYDRALGLLRDLGQPARLSGTLHNIGVAYLSLGRLPEALEHLERALEIRRRLEDPRGQAATLTALGWTRSLRGDEQCALRTYDEALALRRAAGDVLGEATTLDQQGTSYHRMRRHQEALDTYLAALGLLRETGNRLNEAHTLANLGMVYLALGDVEGALVQDRRALELFRQIGDLQGEATVLVAIARAERQNGRLHVAKGRLEQALQLVETVRARLQGQAFRRSYLAARYDDYDSYISLLMELDDTEPGKGHGARAFEAAERVRARGLQEGLATHRGWRQRSDVELRRRELLLRERIQGREALRRELASTGGPADRIELLEEEVQALLVEYRKLDGELRHSAGREAVVSASPVDLPTVQTTLLDQETSLLAYHLGQEESFLWVVETDHFSSHRLPRRAIVQALAQRVGRALIKSETRVLSAQLTADAELLAEQLLAPALPALAKRRVVILADGALATLPFAALPLPSRAPGAGPEPLIEHLEVVHLPSASVLSLLRERREREPTKTLALFADPVFEAGDRRRAGLEAPDVPAPAGDLTRAAGDLGLQRIARLPHAGLEAEAILALVGDPRQSLVALDFEATRDAVLSADLESYRFLHFATHGLLNDHPSLSGIVLSLVDADGRRLDGFLRVHEIERLKLAADLVVLSACSTALGEDIRGEGIVGMSRAFFLAGARAVVVSHWNVDDEATAVLMQRFYAEMLGERGLAPSAALRAAQRSLRRESRWAAPYYWAAFTLQGDWK